MKEVISNQNIRQSDASAIRKISSKELMYKASEKVFENVNWHGKVLIVCGIGNNAGDGYSLSLLLKRNKIPCRIMIIEESFSIDGKYYFDLAKENGIEIEKFNEQSSFDYDIIVDCIFGTGFHGTITDNYQKVINKINDSHSYIVSVDINSGLNGDNGISYGCVISDLTISIGSFKYGHFLNDAKDVIKKLINVDIGIEILKQEAYLIEEDDVRKFFKPRINNSNKGNYGYVGVMGGSSFYPGSIKLASLGQYALNVGSGVSKVIVPSSIKELLFPYVLESTIHPFPCKEGQFVFDKNELEKLLNRLSCLGVGVGMGINEENQKIIEYLVKNAKIPLIIDADGLNNLAKLDLNILNQSYNVILTPHLLEFSRLTSYSVDYIKENSVKVLKEFVNKYRVTVLLKGPTTIVMNKDDFYLINRGCPGMAKGGSGDVLLGVLVGLLGFSKENIGYSVSVGAYINGLAGELASKEFGDYAMVASDTCNYVKRIVADLTKNK
ncbi:MAG: NAD(P)H-hydrate dehydratase [Bacillales bacterium]|nr:NAD(P)H-hydrate dehydratase [Bacillales bacterium]